MTQPNPQMLPPFHPAVYPSHPAFPITRELRAEIDGCANCRARYRAQELRCRVALAVVLLAALSLVLAAL